MSALGLFRIGLVFCLVADVAPPSAASVEHSRPLQAAQTLFSVSAFEEPVLVSPLNTCEPRLRAQLLEGIKRRTLLGLGGWIGAGTVLAGGGILWAQSPPAGMHVNPVAVLKRLNDHFQALRKTQSINQLGTLLPSWRTAAYWENVPDLKPVAAIVAKIVRDLEKEIRARGAAIGWPADTIAAPQFALLLVRQAIARFYAIVDMSSSSDALIYPIVLENVVSLMFQEQYEIGLHLEALRQIQGAAGKPLQAAPSGLFVGPSVLAMIKKLPKRDKPLGEAVKNILQHLPETYQRVDSNFYAFMSALNQVAERFDYGFHYYINTTESGVNALVVWCCHLSGLETASIGGETYRARFAQPVWQTVPDSQASLAGFEFSGTDKVGIVPSNIEEEVKNVWAVKQAARDNAAPAGSTWSFWDPEFKTLIDRRVQEATIENLRQAVLRHLMLHEFWHKWFRAHSRIDLNSSLAVYFGHVLPRGNSTLDTMNEYLVRMGTCAVSDAPFLELIRWTLLLANDDNARTPINWLFSKLIIDLAAQLRVIRPGSFERIALLPANGILSRKDGAAFLREVNTLTVKEVQDAAGIVYTTQFGPLMPAPQYSDSSKTAPEQRALAHAA